ncbi:MAG: LacI family DNA-binding transcriptional regulator [Gemmiger sp.]|nr:LacI family DNA-binding transcriptional regulator [Gemmiger sp.]
MTIKDIAREAGYAVGTVSRVLNNNPNVSPAARAKILEVVKRHNFQPNANAKHLKLQASSGIALVVKGTQNMLFAALIEKMQALIENRGYVSMIYYIDEEDSEVTQATLICQERKPHGIVFLGSNLDYFDASLLELGVPCVLVTNSAAALDIQNLSSVSVDDTAAAARMIDYLVGHGHQKIGVIGGRPEVSRPSLSRLTGCQQAFLRHGLPFDPAQQYGYARFSMESGYQAMNWLLAHYPGMTAVFAMSDLMAMGAMRALQDHGLRVPQDISLAGYDGISLASYCVPRLTTIRQNVERLATRGVEILLHGIEEGTSAVHEIVPFELLEGESVQAPAPAPGNN